MTRRPLKLISYAAPPSARTAQASYEGRLIALLRTRGQLSPRAQALLAHHRRRGLMLTDILIAHRLSRPDHILRAEADLRGCDILDPVLDPPDPRLIDRLGAAACLAQGLLPWRRLGHATVIATARPDLFSRREAMLSEMFGPVLLALADEHAIDRAILKLRGPALARKAETLVPAAESCRDWPVDRLRSYILAALIVLLALVLSAPALLYSALLGWAALTLAATAALKSAAALSEARARLRAAEEPPPPAIMHMPCVSILVPLCREPDILPDLVARLRRLDYPRELLDVLLIVEAGDTATRAALATAPLPPWMRVVPVPAGPLMTKPRALNYALPFCRGTILGVYDAEDAPAPDQIGRVVERFHSRGAEVACLQGVLDYYNPRTNWLARCFTIEYAAWFRVLLPGLARLGFAVPLGGTTLFFRRAALEKLGGWDAHNVTEDADLGLRLARHGFRTELIDTVTAEEANCRPLPWIRQRSRWLKGYMMTWAVHMRRPRLLLSQLGARRFLGVQVLFLGTLSQFLLAPLLWSCWLLAFGLPHPLSAWPWPVKAALIGLFVASGTINLLINALAVSGPRHRHLLPWVPTLAAYFPLGALAAYKGAWELLGQPFFWDKTRHGVEPPEAGPDPAASPAAGPGAS